MALIPDISVKYDSLFKQFLSQPGVFQQLINDLELVKERKYSQLSTNIENEPKSPFPDNNRILPPVSPRSPRPASLENWSLHESPQEICCYPEKDSCIEEAISHLNNTSISDIEANLCDKVPEHKCDIPNFYKVRVFMPVLPPDFVTSVQQLFNCQPNRQVTLQTSGSLAQLCGLPFYLRTPLLSSISRQNKEAISCQEFLSFWQSKANLCQNVSPSEKMFTVMTRFEERNFLTPEDFDPVLEDVLTSHPGLGFFRDDNDPVLFSAYKTVVTTSIFYAASSWRRKRLHLFQAVKIGLFDLFTKVRDKQDVNEVEHFSYDQFYVVYVKFAEMDSNNDMELDYTDLMDYFGGEGVSEIVMMRILDVNRTQSENNNMRLEDFLVLLMAEVDKSTPQAMEYWFRVLDLDSDGVLSLQELFTFFEVNNSILITLDLLQQFGVQFEDIVCQLIDSTSQQPSTCYFSLPDIKKNSRFPHLVNAFVNIFKFISEDENSECCIKTKLTAWEKYIQVQAVEMQASEL